MKHDKSIKAKIYSHMGGGDGGEEWKLLLDPQV